MTAPRTRVTSGTDSSIPANTFISLEDLSTLKDPSALTTDAITREVGSIQRDLTNLKESLQRDLDNRAETRQREQEFQDKLFATKLDGIQKTFEAEIESINKATDLRLGVIQHIPEDIKSEIDHHENLQVERFKSIAQQFNERDIRTEQAGKASTEALAAALQAAKELVGAQGEASAAAAIKSETSFTKQIDQIGTIIQTLEKALDARITELKERIDRGEGNNSGTKEAQANAAQEAAALVLSQLNSRTESRAGNSQGLIVGSLFISALAVISSIVMALLR